MEFYKGKKVFITGNTGFKGSWLSLCLLRLGAEVCGYSDRKGPLFELCGLETEYETIYGDIRDYEALRRALKAFNPDIVIHMAAQPLVLQGYQQPRETFETNVMGTVNLMTAARELNRLGSLVNVTTDKVYRNEERKNPFREEDSLGGEDPYSCSKSCSEMVTQSFVRSYSLNCNVSTARAGNVIGGGDFSENRILPDCIRAAESCTPILLRNPGSVRPWQHVLEPLNGYLTLARALYENETKEASFNFGPESVDCLAVGELTDLFCKFWGENIIWKPEMGSEEAMEQARGGNSFREAGLLMLDSSKAKKLLDWQHRWNVSDAVSKTVEWHRAYTNREKMAREISLKQIDEYFRYMPSISMAG